MPYLALRFDADAAHAERWADALLAAGALSVDVSDPHAGTAAETPRYGEPHLRAESYWPVNRLTALFAAGTDVEAALTTAGAAADLPPPPHETAPVADQDWVTATQAQFTPIEAAPGLWIVPSWCTPVDAEALNITLDPGLAFGTGSHPTTRLCLAWLAATPPRGARVLDYGCGSGILAIAAAKLGAAYVAGTDIDPQAIRASRDNGKRNDVAVSFLLPDALADAALPLFDVIVANILASPLVLLAPALAARLGPRGRIVLSGILAPQAQDVVAAYAPWFNIAVWRSEDGWSALAGERRADSS